MQGNVDNALMLVCAGNHFLGGHDVTGFWPDAHTFSFMKLAEFRRQPPAGAEADDYPLVALDPIDWFDQLKPSCRGLRLHHVTPVRNADQRLDVPDRMLVGFVGGGQRWLIEAVGASESDLWEGFLRVGDRNDPQRRIWKCTHILQGRMPRSELDASAATTTLADASAHFRKALVRIETYARDEKYDNFADLFNEAIDLIDAGKLREPDEDLIRFAGLDDRRQSLYAACARASVFGGMGSWNDLGGGERYDRVSQALYESLNDCIVALANSTFRG